MLWTEIPVHVIDFEGSRETGIVEFGAVTLERGAIAASATRVCRSRRHVRGDETRVHGLADADLAGAAPFEDEWERFASYRSSGVLAAHFSGTENSLLRAAWPCPRLSPDFLQPGRDVAEWGPWIDTGRLVTRTLPHGASAALESVIAQLELSHELASRAAELCPPERRRFHCALFDALAAALVLRRLACERDGSAWTLVRLMAESQGDDERRDALTQTTLF